MTKKLHPGWGIVTKYICDECMVVCTVMPVHGSFDLVPLPSGWKSRIRHGPNGAPYACHYCQNCAAIAYEYGLAIS